MFKTDWGNDGAAYLHGGRDLADAPTARRTLST
jgi:hypothetical protein